MSLIYTPYGPDMYLQMVVYSWPKVRRLNLIYNLSCTHFGCCMHGKRYRYVCKIHYFIELYFRGFIQQKCDWNLISIRRLLGVSIYSSYICNNVFWSFLLTSVRLVITWPDENTHYVKLKLNVQSHEPTLRCPNTWMRGFASCIEIYAYSRLFVCWTGTERHRNLPTVTTRSTVTIHAGLCANTGMFIKLGCRIAKEETRRSAGKMPGGNIFITA